jgi:hypothetical protein
MRQYTWIAIVALLAALPAPGQQIIQRMERDVVAAEKLQQTMEEAPLLGLADLKNIALSGRFSRDLRSEESGILRRSALRLSRGDYALARKDWQSALSKMKEREFEPDVDALIYIVLKQAYLDKDVNFQPLADAVQFREQQRAAAYQERTSLERLKAVFDEGKASDDLRFQPLILADKYAPGVRPVERAESVTPTVDSVSTELQKIVVLCNAADDNAQQAVVDLQQALDGQILQTMSNASKMLHDTAKPIISNTKG